MTLLPAGLWKAHYPTLWHFGLFWHHTKLTLTPNPNPTTLNNTSGGLQKMDGWMPFGNLRLAAVQNKCAHYIDNAIKMT